MALDFQIIGAGRGGTSLIAGLLDYHSHCEVMFEALATQFLMDREKEPSSRIENFLHAADRTSQGFPGRLFGHKTTTEQISTLGAGAQLFVKATAEVPVIFIVRNRDDCIKSKMRRTGQALEAAERNYDYCIQCLSWFKRDAQQIHVIKMEELISDPNKYLRATCAFLCIPFETEMLNGTLNPKMPVEYRRNGFDPILNLYAYRGAHDRDTSGAG